MSRRRGGSLAAVLACAIALGASSACSSSSSSSTGTDGDAGTSSSTTDGAKAACNTLDYAGAPVTPVAKSGAAPTAAGGAIENGTYRLVGYQVYNTTLPASPPTIQGTIFIMGQVYQIAFVAGMGEDRESGTAMTTGNTITLTMDCPAQGMESTRRFTYAGGMLQLYDVSTAGATEPAEIAIYMKQ